MSEKSKKKLPRGIRRFIDEVNDAYSEATNDPLILSALEHLSLLLAQEFKIERCHAESRRRVESFGGGHTFGPEVNWPKFLDKFPISSF
jgi:hypothetical protein